MRKKCTIFILFFCAACSGINKIEVNCPNLQEMRYNNAVTTKHRSILLSERESFSRFVVQDTTILVQSRVVVYKQLLGGKNEMRREEVYAQYRPFHPWKIVATFKPPLKICDIYRVKDTIFISGLNKDRQPQVWKYYFNSEKETAKYQNARLALR